MTAKWWVIQEQIKSGEVSYKALPESVLAICKEIMSRKYEKVQTAGNRTSKQQIGTCPRCGGSVIEGKFGYGCSNWRDGCRFVIWKKAKGGMLQKIEITPTVAKKLLDGKEVHSKKLYSPSKQKTFEASYKLADKGSQYGAEFELIFSRIKR